MHDALSDPTNRRILATLQQDGRLTNQDLAERVHLSPSPCWRRTRDLEKAKVIRRYAAILDPEACGFSVCVFTLINLEMHNDESLGALERAVARQPEILECYAITGDADFILKIHVRDIAHYNRILSDVLFRIPGMKHLKSTFALREVKNDTALPIAE